jgi:hypothetical protein
LRHFSKERKKRITSSSKIEKTFQGPTQTTEKGLAEMFQALSLAVSLLELSFEAERLDQCTYLSMLASSRSLFSEIRLNLKDQELSGTEVTALIELQRTLFEAGSRETFSGGRYLDVDEDHDVHQSRRRTKKILRFEED